MLLPHPVACGEESIVQKELERRVQNASKAYELMSSGDEAYKASNYKNASESYAQAFSLLPRGILSHELRSAAAERYATATTEYCRSLAKNGAYDQARMLLDEVLNPAIAPAHTGALKLRSQIDNPTRYNPALTPDHVDDVVKVGRLLRKAEGQYQLGQYNQAHQTFQSVLRIDPFNKAARRGMERIDVIQSDYYRAARDQARSEMLAAVDSSWELYVPAADGNMPIAAVESPSSSKISLENKLAGIMVDNIVLDDVNLQEAIEFVRLQSRIGDALDASDQQLGINVLLNLGDPSSNAGKIIAQKRVNITARNIPLSKLLDYITEQTQTQWKTDGVSVIINPLGALDSTLR